MNEILINLKSSINAKQFEKGNLIHIKEFMKVQEWINERIDKLKNQDNNNQKERLQDTITILGSRGSGKTTFLLSILKECKNQRKNEIEVIDIIDPTLIEEKGHIFLTIISQIKDLVERKLMSSDCNPESSDYILKSEWRKQLKTLSHGLPSMDGIGGDMDEQSWQDPEYIMDKGLKSVQSAINLENNFHQFVKMSLKIIGKEAFILPLDDIDIDFRKGWSVLETIRKYMTSPLIITIISGNLKLFSQSIRKQQWSNFGKALLKNEGDKLHKLADYNDLVTEMEGQYLQKVMKPQRRIHLTTLLEKINLYSTVINITNGVNSNNIDYVNIQEHYDTIFAQFGIRNRYQAEAYRSFLLSLPIRSQIQFMSEYNEKKQNLKEVNVADVFLSDLYEKQVNIDHAKSTSKFLNGIILDLLIREKTLDEAYQLQPTTSDVSLNSSLITLSFLFSQRTLNDPYLIFDYFIKIGYVRNLRSSLDYQGKDNRINKFESLHSPSIEGLCKHSAIFQDRGIRDIVCYMTTYIRAFLNTGIGNSNNKQIRLNLFNWGGTIVLPGFAFKSKKVKILDSERIDFIFKSESLFNRQIAYIPLSVSQPTNKQQSILTYSVYVLLGAIGELIRYNKDSEGDLDKAIEHLSQVRSYPMPNFSIFSVDEYEDETTFETSDLANKTENPKNSLSEMIRVWINSYPKDYAIIPHLLGKISTRVFYAFGNLENKNPFNNLGDAMHHRIIILLNSILLEDARENLPSLKTDIINSTLNLSNDNPNGSNKIFIDNLNKLNEHNKISNTKNALKFSKWMLSCPLFLLYLNNNMQTDKNEDYITPFTLYISDYFDNEKGGQPIKDIISSSIYPLLNKVLIKISKEDVDIKHNNESENSVPLFSSYNFTERIRVIKLLEQHKIPFDWFNNNLSRQQKIDINRSIKLRCEPLFKRRIDTDDINRLRKFLFENRISW